MWREIAIQILLKWYVYQVVCLGHIATVTACNMGPNDRLFLQVFLQCGAGLAQRLCNGLSCNDPGFDSRSGL